MKIWRFEVYLVIVFIALVIVLGILPSYFQLGSNTNWLARSGAIVVMLGTILTYAQFSQWKEKILKKLYGAKLSQAFKNAKLSGKPNQIFLPNVDIERYEIKRRLLRAGVIYILLGTFIWGYGDVPFI